jgi:hypothetical protein
MANPRRTSPVAMLIPMAAFAWGDMLQARCSPSTAAAPISDVEDASCCRRRKLSALASLVLLSLCISAVCRMVRPSLRRTPPNAGGVQLRACRLEPASPSTQWINESVGRGLPVGPLASLSDGGARRRSTSGHARCATRTSCPLLQVATTARELSPVPSGLFHTGHVPGDRPRMVGLAMTNTTSIRDRRERAAGKAVRLQHRRPPRPQQRACARCRHVSTRQ